MGFLECLRVRESGGGGGGGGGVEGRSDLPFELRYHLPGYVWYGNNRKSISKRATRGSGDILLKDWVIQQCYIHVLDSCFKGILRLQL